MIELTNFQINIFSIFFSLVLLLALFLKKIDLLSILALTSSFYNLVIFNYKPWTFGFQIFFFFALLFILFSFKNFLNNLKNNLTLLMPVFIFILIVIIGEIFVYFHQPQILVIRPAESELTSVQETFKFSRLNITQALYVIFFFMISLGIIFEKDFDFVKIFKFYLIGLNINLFIQLIQIFSSLYKYLSNFLINLSFTQETIQKAFWKDFAFYRYSGLIPTPSLLGIHLFIGILILILFKDQFPLKFFILELVSLFISGIISVSATFFLVCFIGLLIWSLKEKKYFVLIFLLLLLPFLIYHLIYKQSFEIRIKNALFSLKIFKEYPLLGIGVGSHFSSDLLTTLLATTGISGFLTFFLIFFIPFLQSIKAKEKLLTKLSLLSLLPLVLILLTWHAFNINFYWLILGIWYNKLNQCLG